MMKERPILMHGRSVRAILEGRKTQTRRVIGKPLVQPDEHGLWPRGTPPLSQRGDCPYGQRGELLWVRETWRPDDFDEGRTIYRADYPEQAVRETKGIIKWVPAIHMPRSRCRLVLEITGIRVERVQEITPADCEAEGIVVIARGGRATTQQFRPIWDEINAKRGYGWDTNCWVWVLEFTPCSPPAGEGGEDAD